eukprot:CAMPEP_0197693194 /NCGR_PEP_ID=MMETSP1338-20131121/112146_1 /TAXON_ID=43686 ORGANISM="Pelagodinium beii, Strain RCC1491" /NCGR_SAMPLE_ID=MMETSP1338 /ASSEMBLY_ACC=CAM_ASM_000754 /LENGTH=38 /DNA_ID= /DNA_START= /DNA_END= /DNA_ORIENTATION=
MDWTAVQKTREPMGIAQVELGPVELVLLELVALELVPM